MLTILGVMRYGVILILLLMTGLIVAIMRRDLKE